MVFSKKASRDHDPEELSKRSLPYLNFVSPALVQDLLPGSVDDFCDEDSHETEDPEASDPDQD